MLAPMDTPRRTYTFGPITITIRRGEDDSGVRRVGAPASVLVHILVIALVVILSTEQEKRAAQEAHEKKPPVEITFYDPLPPPPKPRVAAPKPAPRPPKENREPTFPVHPLVPPPPTQKPLRMQPAPDTIAKLKNAPDHDRRGSAGQRDTRPAGGLAGGPLPKPTNGVPESGSIGREVDAPPGTERPDEPKDLEGRLRDFRRALEAPRPPTKGPKGGGSGTGGIEMPQMPETGFGVGNLDFEPNGYNWGDYGTQAYWAILRAWYRRLLADSGVFERWASEKNRWMLDDSVKITFTISRSGQVVDIVVDRPSACFPLDDSAREALQEVVLPPLPADFQLDSETVHARFVAEGPIRGMRQQLQYLHDVGWF